MSSPEIDLYFLSRPTLIQVSLRQRSSKFRVSLDDDDDDDNNNNNNNDDDK